MIRLFKTDSAMSTDEALEWSSRLRSSASRFCRALLNPPPPSQLLQQHFSSRPRITEHGPKWATERLPFLGKTFTGPSQCVEYFTLLGQTLDMEASEFTFPPTSCFIVDPEAHTSDEGAENKGVVSVVASATFKAVKTGREWEEQCIYRLSDFDEDGRIGHWEIWADPLSAWEAVGG